MSLLNMYCNMNKITNFKRLNRSCYQNLNTPMASSAERVFSIIRLLNNSLAAILNCSLASSRGRSLCWTRLRCCILISQKVFSGRCCFLESVQTHVIQRQAHAHEHHRNQLSQLRDQIVVNFQQRGQTIIIAHFGQFCNSINVLFL